MIQRNPQSDLLVRRVSGSSLLLYLVGCLFWCIAPSAASSQPPKKPLYPDVFINIDDSTEVDGLAISPDDKCVAFTGSGRGGLSPRLFLFNSRTGDKWTAPKESELGMRVVAFAPNGKTMVSAGSKNMWIWEVGSWKVLHKQERGYGATHLAYSADSKMLATTESNNKVCLWEVPSGKLIVALPFFAKNAGLFHLAFSPDGKVLAAANYAYGIAEVWNLSGTVPLKELHNHKPQFTLDCEEKGLCFVGFTPDSKSLVTVSATRARVWGATTGAVKTRHLIVCDKNNLTSYLPWRETAALSPDGKTLALSGTDCFVA